jgi:glyoxylase-like metal-dependent hydrolase (beta-lactamase superfamily II)
MRGHSPGSQVIYVQSAKGREYLFVGDIVWTRDSIDRLTTRPRFLQWIMFDPNEERERVLTQVRGLHDLQEAEPELVIVPSHDLGYLEELSPWARSAGASRCAHIAHTSRRARVGGRASRGSTAMQGVTESRLDHVRAWCRRWR